MSNIINSRSEKFVASTRAKSSKSEINAPLLFRPDHHCDFHSIIIHPWVLLLMAL